jgi:hypothetical protein
VPPGIVGDAAERVMDTSLSWLSRVCIWAIIELYGAASNVNGPLNWSVCYSYAETPKSYPPISVKRLSRQAGVPKSEVMHTSLFSQHRPFP